MREGHLSNRMTEKRALHLPHLHVFRLVGLLVNSLQAFLSSRGLLEIQIVAIDRSAAIKCRWLPQDHDGGVTNLEDMKTNRSTLEDKLRKLNDGGIIWDLQTHCYWTK